ncbi:MAG: adenylate/guanylate cyclase domain-containing protein, partial [Hyphomicrobiaceae bacterium]
MQLRVGVNIGEVIVDEGDIFGEGVNIAARLEAVCEPGGIAISDNVHEQVMGKLTGHFHDAGLHDVKNISRPIKVWRWADDASASGANVTGVDPKAEISVKPSIAVLPFKNMSGDPDQEFIADGVAEDIITALSRYRWLTT